MRASIDDFNAVQAAAQKYADAVGSGNENICKPVFLDNAVMFGFLDGKLQSGTIQNLYNSLKEVGADPKFRSRVDVVFIDGTVALARVLEDNWANHDFTDYLMLIKIGKEWKIAAKVYNQVPK